MAGRQGDLSFKFCFVADGNAQGFFATKASATVDAMQLGEDEVRFEEVSEVIVLDNRVILAFREGATHGPTVAKSVQQGSLLVLEVYGVEATTLERHIERSCSKHAAKRTQARYDEEGKAHLFKTLLCPVCEATVDVSEAEDAQHHYCHYCETVFDPQARTVTSGETYRVCGECEYFGQVKGYTEFYFYFLLVIYGWRHSRIHVCVNCANAVFWKMFFANLIFVLGVPNAIWFKMQTMRGRDPKLAELAGANARAQAGDLSAAQVAYLGLDKKVPGHPALAYNEGLARLQGDDGGGAIECFVRSVEACPNYLPSLRILARMQEVIAQQEDQAAQG